MKRFILVFALVCITLCTQAQIYASLKQEKSTVVSPIVVQPTKVVYEVTTPPGLRMRNAGRFMTIAGGALLVGGIAVFSSADEKYYTYTSTNNGTVEEGDPKAALGLLMMVAGGGLTIPGVILWTKGAKKYNRFMEKQAALNFKGNGISVSYHF
ncbi:hypothetical protein [Chryseolinea lacunae]|uniref:DUF4134 domain-containing protein n=1 Tax=Chryseolinea lacunae TaxID=2801331 RepID=A0ABS1KP31_9BACT|nr:hypothetical protein [Chryseolinea lacunae]MBL0741243.1 hypothetical protein [Chryseolinea lacunae]